MDAQQIIENALQNSMSYTQYMELHEKLVREESTSGNNKSADMVEYTKLNLTRSKRWNKTIVVSPDTKEIIASYDDKVTWLVITETWCGDAAHIIPAINKVAELNQNIDLRLVLRDENEALMDQFLTNGSKSIPKLIALNNKLEVIGTFGSRPEVAAKMVKEFIAENGSLTPRFRMDLQLWYNKDKGKSTIQDLMGLLVGAEVK